LSNINNEKNSRKIQGLIVRTYNKGDEEQIVDLLKISFKEWEKRKNAIDYWKWKYQDSPLGHLIEIGEKDNKIIGVGHDIIFNFKIFDTIKLVKYGDDSATHPKYRGMGIYNILSNFTEKLRFENNIKMHYSITTNPIIYKTGIKDNRTYFPFTLSHFIKIKNINYHLKNINYKHPRLFKTGFLLLKLINLIKFNNIQSKNRKIDYDIIQITEFNKKFDIFWEKIKNDYDFITEKNSQYFNWRFNHIFGKYIIKSAIKNNEIIGFIISEIINDGDYTEAYILDIITLKERLDVATNLLNDACKQLTSLGVNTIHIKLIQNSRYFDLLKKLGFIDISNISKMKILVTDYEGKGDSFEKLSHSSPKRIHFTVSDYL
jgi:hypothetical protein